MNEYRLRPTTAVAVTADLLVLARFMPDWAELTRDLSAPRSWVSRVGVDAAAVTVKPGESLWLIAAHRLGPTSTDADIAAEWPRWYAANRTTVGDDPALLRPGQQLTSPSASTAGQH